MTDTFLWALHRDRRPLLTREQEAVLGARIRDGDEQAWSELVERNLRLAVSVAKKHRNRGLDFDELIQSAILGVMIAARKFDPDLGWKFSSYCTWWCRAEIGRALQKTSRTVRLSAPVYQDLQRIRAAERALLVTTSHEITAAMLAADTGLTEDRVAEVLALGEPMVSLNKPAYEETRSTGDMQELGDRLPGTGPAPEDLVAVTLRDEALSRALRLLPYRWRRIIVMRHGLAGEEQRTLDSIAAIFKVQREQVRILQARAEASLADDLS